MIKNLTIEIAAFVLSFMIGVYLLIFAPARYLTWHALARSPEPAAEIIDTTVDTVTVRTTSDEKFLCNIYNEKECWIEVRYESLQGRPLWCFPEDYSTEHTVQIVKACSQSHNFGIIGTIYSLHDDGIIYVKHKGYISPEGYCFGTIFGLFFAILAFIGKRLFLAITSFFQGKPTR
jgi:hypothetical protein